MEAEEIKVMKLRKSETKCGYITAAQRTSYTFTKARLKSQIITSINNREIKTELYTITVMNIACERFSSSKSLDE